MKKASILILLFILISNIFVISCSAEWCKGAHDYALGTADFFSKRWACLDKQKLAHDLIFPLDATVCHGNQYPGDLRIATSLICNASVQFMAIAGAYVMADRYKCNPIFVYKDLSNASILCTILVVLKGDSIEESYAAVINGKIKWDEQPTEIDYTPAWELKCITADCSDNQLVINRE